MDGQVGDGWIDGERERETNPILDQSVKGGRDGRVIERDCLMDGKVGDGWMDGWIERERERGDNNFGRATP